jgi:hypothetical protein
LSQGPAAGISEPPQDESRDPSNTQGGPTDQSRRSSETTKSTAGQGGERQVATQGTGGTEPGAEQTEGTPRPAGAAQTSGKGNQGQGKGQTSGGGGGGGGSSSSATASSQAQSGTSGAGAGGQTSSTDTKGKPEGKPNEKSDQETGGGGGKRETPAAPKFNWLLWLLLLLLLALIIYLLIRYRDAVKLFLARAWQALCAPFIALWAALQRLWARFMAYFGRRARAGDDSGEVPLPVNPFEDIFSNRYLFENLTPSQMATHVYRAFMALCDLRGHGRLAEQTEREFLRVVPDGVGIARPDREGITGVYIQARYSPSSVGPDAVPGLQDYWSRLKPQIDATLAAMGRAAVRRAT